MRDIVLLRMRPHQRITLQDKHRFYVCQAKSRMMSQFDESDIRNEADREGESFLEENKKCFNPELHDGSAFLELAGNARDDRYQLLAEMRDRVRLSIVAGFFHDWEKNLRQWLVDEMQRSPLQIGDSTRHAIWNINLCSKGGDLFELLESFGWELKAASYFADLNAGRLVVNVYKHGDGHSLESLSRYYPKFLKHPLGGLCEWTEEKWSHRHLYITDGDLDAFSDAVLDFWANVPESVFNSQITDPPNWLMKALERDSNKKDQSK